MKGVSFTCPSCATALQVAHEVAAGTPIECPQCHCRFPAPPARPSAPQQYTCPSCKLPLQTPSPVAPGTLVQCPKCNHRFRTPPVAQPVAPAAVLPSAPPAAPSSDPQPLIDMDWSRDLPARPSAAINRNRPGKGPARRVIVAGLVAAVVVIGGGIALLVGTGTSETPPPANPGPRVKKEAPPEPAGAKKQAPTAPASRKPEQPPAKKPPVARFARLEDWPRDFELAKRQAVREKKDVFIFFSSLEGNADSVRHANEVVLQEEFRNRAPKNFVLVFADASQLGNPGQTAGLWGEFGIARYPRVVLTDAQGRPFSVEDLAEADAGELLRVLLQRKSLRLRRDQLLAQAEKARGAAKLEPARDALQFFGENHLTRHYGELVQEWAELARTHDPKNERGLFEVFFEAEWLEQVRRAGPDDARELLRCVSRLDAWSKAYRFKDANRGGGLFLLAANLLTRADRYEQALQALQRGLSCQPTDKDLLRALTNFATTLGLGSGTGFVVAPGGHLLTNHHVVAGKGRVLVRLPGNGNLVRAQVLASDAERDMALIRIAVPKDTPLPPLALAGKRAVGLGEKVAALGYPLGDLVGGGLKLTTGVVSATPEVGNDHMLVLDARINPGNSGGPLCDGFGNVVGMVTAKSLTSGRIESYGIALPAADLEAFLRKSLKGYMPPAAQTKAVQWDEVARAVRPSVLMVLKTPG